MPSSRDNRRKESLIIRDLTFILSKYPFVFLTSSMLFPSSRSLTAIFALLMAPSLFAQGMRTKLIAPPELWIRADVERDWGEPVVLTTCASPIAWEETREERTNSVTGGMDVVRTFAATCPCSEVLVREQQVVHVFPAVPLPQSSSGGGCAPSFAGAPTTLERRVGERGAWQWDGTGACAEAWQEVEFPLWFNACGVGESWLVWEASGACGDVARHGLVVRTVAEDAPTGSIALAASVDEAFFEADDFTVGPLTGEDVDGVILPAAPTYRTWGTGSGGFQLVTVGCGNTAVVGEQVVEVTGNNAPWFRLRPEVEMACGTEPAYWPEVRCQDRPVAGFGPDPDPVELPFEETWDTIPGDCAGNFTIHREFFAEDDQGAEATASQSLIYRDQSPPTFFNSPDELVWHGEDWPPEGPTAQAEDACDGNVTLVWADSLDCASGGLIRITTATDGCGNLASLRQRVLPKEPTPQFILAVGCPDPSALNYTADACYSEVHCLYAGDTDCMGDLDGNGTISTGDLLELLGIFGALCPAD